MSQTKKKQVERVKKKAQKYIGHLIQIGFPIKAAFLFGSYATGTFHQESDIDICIISERFRTNWDENEKLLWRETRYVDPRIEPIGYSPEAFQKSIILGKIIRKQGIKIY